jgi:hypothetical protein
MQFGCKLHPNCIIYGTVWVQVAFKLHPNYTLYDADWVQFAPRTAPALYLPYMVQFGCTLYANHTHTASTVPTTRIQQPFPLVHDSCGHHSSCTARVCIMRVVLIGMPSSCPCAASHNMPGTNGTANDEVYDMYGIMSTLISIRFVISMRIMRHGSHVHVRFMISMCIL